jgi:tripartite-type tricarboxylate transporter receptor subunit TctC
MKLSKTVLAAITLSLGSAVHAAYPEKPVTMVVTYPPGGTVDAVARLIGPSLSKALGQTVVIENKGGASGMIGGAYVARAKPDGYTIMLDASNFAQNFALRQKMSFSAADFEPVSLLLKVPNVLVVNPQSEYQNVADVIEAGQSAQPAHFASAGPGSAQHLAGELFNLKAKTHLSHVAYKGGGPAMTDVMGGQVPIMFASLGSSWPHIKAGKLKVLATGGDTPSALLPNIPTLDKSGVPNFSSYEWNAVFAPKDTPAEVIQILSTAITKVLQDPNVVSRLKALGADIEASTPQALQAFVAAEETKWRTVAKEARITLD